MVTKEEVAVVIKVVETETVLGTNPVIAGRSLSLYLSLSLSVSAQGTGVPESPELPSRGLTVPPALAGHPKLPHPLSRTQPWPPVVVFVLALPLPSHAHVGNLTASPNSPARMPSWRLSRRSTPTALSKRTTNWYRRSRQICSTCRPTTAVPWTTLRVQSKSSAPRTTSHGPRCITPVPVQRTKAARSLRPRSASPIPRDAWPLIPTIGRSR